MGFLLWKVFVFCILPSVILMSTISRYDINCPYPNEVFASTSGAHCEQKCWKPNLKSTCYYLNLEQKYEDTAKDPYVGCICGTGFARNTISGMCVPVHMCDQYSQQLTDPGGYQPWGLIEIVNVQDNNPPGPQPPPPY